MIKTQAKKESDRFGNYKVLLNANIMKLNSGRELDIRGTVALIKMKKGQLKIQVQENHRFSVPQSSKAQLKIQEMAFMLMAVIIFFVMAGMFFLIIMFNDLRNQANILEKEGAVATAVDLANTPEFSCGYLCMDADKLIVMKDKKAYENFWPITSLTVVKVSNEEKIECNEQNYPYCNYFDIYDKEVESEQGVDTYVSLCRKEKIDGYVYDKCEIGRLIVGFEKQN